MAQPLRIIELEFTILEFYPQYVLSIPREGKVVEKKEVADLVEVCSEFYDGKSFVYISNRINDFNVNPTIYLNLGIFENLAGICVVSKKASSLNMANFEKSFCKIPFEIFMELPQALEWVNNVIGEKNKKADL